MNRLLIILLVIICFAHAIEYSHRIQALGTDFAYLVPDYETDLYRNPQLLTQKLAGISYDANSSEPLTLIFSSNRFGIYGKYWPSYSYKLISTENGWTGLKSSTFYVEDLWMLKIKNEVWNIYNEGYFSRDEYFTSDGYNSLTKMFEYIIKAQTSYNIGKSFNIDIKAAAGFYERISQTDYYDIYNQRVGLLTGRIGLFYRNNPLENKFTSWFIDLGGPITTSEIRALPYSIYADMYEYERKLKYFANTFISRISWAKGLPINDKSFVVIGWHDDFLYQRAEQTDTNITLCGIRNTLSFPLAVECVINKFSLRFGTKLCYEYEYLKESSNTAIVSQDISHQINYDYSFGLGWQPNEHFVIDLYNNSDLANLRNWSIYLKYLF